MQKIRRLKELRQDELSIVGRISGVVNARSIVVLEQHEDARFVLFQNDDGTRVYYATYTAYDGKLILPQFLETSDFLHFKFITLNGPAVQNKGMALFPRKVDGRYAMLSRQDNENIFLMQSDNIHFWY